MSESAEQGNWDEDFVQDNENKNSNSNSDKGDGPRAEWMKFDKPGSYQVRLCGTFVKFHRWWSPFTTRLITHLSYKDEDPAWNAGHWPRKTYAIHVIDRKDTDEEHPTGKLKILEKGSSIFEVFANYKRINGVNPAGKSGPDFIVDVKWPGGNKRQATYTVTPMMKVTEWTEKEVAMIKSEHIDLKKMYAPSPLEKIQEAWDALPDDAKIPPKRDEKGGGDSGYSSKTSQSSRPAQPSRPEPTEPTETLNISDDDDLFGDTDDSTGF